MVKRDLLRMTIADLQALSKENSLPIEKEGKPLMREALIEALAPVVIGKEENALEAAEKAEREAQAKRHEAEAKLAEAKRIEDAKAEKAMTEKAMKNYGEKIGRFELFQVGSRATLVSLDGNPPVLIAERIHDVRDSINARITRIIGEVGVK